MTPVKPPQPSSSPGTVDQLTTPINAPEFSNTGASESPMQAPRPARVLCVIGSTRWIYSDPGLPVTVSAAMRGKPRPIGVPGMLTPKPATTRVSPMVTRSENESLAGATNFINGTANLTGTKSAVAPATGLCVPVSGR